MDLMRLTLQGFRHDRLLTELVQHPDVAALQTKIRDIEEDPFAKGDPIALHQAYMGVRADWLVSEMQTRRREDTNVTWTASTPEFLSSQASSLHRFLVAHLIHAGMIDYLPGRIKGVERNGEQFLVRYEDGNTEKFDRVVLRHGPEALRGLREKQLAFQAPPTTLGSRFPRSLPPRRAKRPAITPSEQPNLFGKRMNRERCYLL